MQPTRPMGQIKHMHCLADLMGCGVEEALLLSSPVQHLLQQFSGQVETCRCFCSNLMLSK